MSTADQTDEFLANRTLDRFRIDCDDSPGGYLASYGCGPIGAGCNDVAAGWGRSKREAANDAIERMRELFALPEADWERLQESADRLSDSEASCEEQEREVADEVCRERFGRGLDEATHDEQQVSWDECMGSDPSELQCAILLHWRE